MRASPAAGHRPARHRARALALLVVALLLVPVSGCGTPDEPAVATVSTPGVPRVEEAITYWSDDRSALQLDACLPTGVGLPTRALVIVHGGGFTGGDRVGGGSRALCELAAKLGEAAFSIDYRLAPEYVYPAQVDDLANAVRWLRDPAQVQRFGIDPGRIGVIGSSAGAVIAQSLATRGEGPLDAGDRVSAVASLSGVSLLTLEGLQLGRPSAKAAALVLGYLGCASANDCPQAAAASPVISVDSSDPPMLLVNGTGELVPQEQAMAMHTALNDSGVPNELVIVDEPKHGAALLTGRVRQELREFLTRYV